jgi:hypothetical protein
VSESPIDQLLGALHALDAERVAELFADDGRLLIVDGRRATGKDAVRGLLGEVFAAMRSAAYRVSGEWCQEDTWIAEVEGSYVMSDWLEINGLPRALVLRMGADGIEDLRVYGAHERPLSEHRTGEEGMWIGDRWVPPL